MAITAPISMSKIQTEFQGPNNLRAYNRGGSYVPNISANNNISTDTNNLSQFLGAMKQPPFAFTTPFLIQVGATIWNKSPYDLFFYIQGATIVSHDKTGAINHYTEPLLDMEVWYTGTPPPLEGRYRTKHPYEANWSYWVNWAAMTNNYYVATGWEGDYPYREFEVQLRPVGSGDSNTVTWPIQFEFFNF